MKKAAIILFLTGVFLSTYAQQVCPVIPLPDYTAKKDGTFSLNKGTVIVVKDERAQPVANYLQRELLRSLKMAVPIKNEGQFTTIVLSYNKEAANIAGAYTLVVSENQVSIGSRDNEGLFNGINSLLQLIKNKENAAKSFNIDCWQIKDKPLYGWRGLMLDESRHFFGKEKVKQILDWMAFYKLNRFHWHLTDQPGWRLEIKQYPRLTVVGGIGNSSNENAPAKYYTQEDIKEIVAYASERFIVVIPEIDMPGHATAANKAYPEFSGGGSKEFPEFTFNPGKDSTYQYLTNILKEADVLFPSQMIHIGGDEVYFGNEKWKTDASVGNLMRKENLPDLKAVEHYFFQRMADSLQRIGNKTLAWDEVAESVSPKSETIIFWWRQDKPEALKIALDKGVSVVLCPRIPFYYDFVQDSTHLIGRKWKDGEYSALKTAYQFSAQQIPEAANKEKYILGIQANLWTESIATAQRVDYMLFPRISALAEAAWTEPGKRNYKQFETRLKEHLLLYKKDSLYYYDPFNPDLNREPRN